MISTSKAAPITVALLRGVKFHGCLTLQHNDTAQWL